jgi:hypothetical protein
MRKLAATTMGLGLLVSTAQAQTAPTRYSAPIDIAPYTEQVPTVAPGQTIVYKINPTSVPVVSVTQYDVQVWLTPYATLQNSADDILVQDIPVTLSGPNPTLAAEWEHVRTMTAPTAEGKYALCTEAQFDGHIQESRLCHAFTVAAPVAAPAPVDLLTTLIGAQIGQPWDILIGRYRPTTQWTRPNRELPEGLFYDDKRELMIDTLNLSHNFEFMIREEACSTCGTRTAPTPSVSTSPSVEERVAYFAVNAALTHQRPHDKDIQICGMPGSVVELVVGQSYEAKLHAYDVNGPLRVGVTATTERVFTPYEAPVPGVAAALPVMGDDEFQLVRIRYKDVDGSGTYTRGDIPTGLDIVKINVNDKNANPYAIAASTYFMGVVTGLLIPLKGIGIPNGHGPLSIPGGPLGNYFPGNPGNLVE